MIISLYRRQFSELEWGKFGTLCTPATPESQWPTTSFFRLISLKRGFSQYSQGSFSSLLFKAHSIMLNARIIRDNW